MKKKKKIFNEAIYDLIGFLYEEPVSLLVDYDYDNILSLLLSLEQYLDNVRFNGDWHSEAFDEKLIPLEKKQLNQKVNDIENKTAELSSIVQQLIKKWYELEEEIETISNKYEIEYYK